ncbi:SH2 domain-containing adapter heavyweight isoform 2-T5 [Glossina fuscipes fuscipes]
MMMANSAPCGTVMMYPNPNSGREVLSSNPTVGNNNQATTATSANATVPSMAASATTATAPDISLRQRAVAKLRMFNFHLNWDLQMTHCKPCGSGSGGNIITRRLCRNRRREDNELYRSNSFKFERFERKEYMEELADTLQKQIAICDDYSLPVDFVKKRPSSFDPCLAEALPTNPENWTAASPQKEFVNFTEHTEQQQPSPPPPPPAPLSTLPSKAGVVNAHLTALNIADTLGNLPPQVSLSLQIAPPPSTVQSQGPLHHHSTLQQLPGYPSLKLHSQRSQTQHRLPHPQLPFPGIGAITASTQGQTSIIKQASVKIIEGYSDPKDSKRHKKFYHKKAKKRPHKSHQPPTSSQSQQLSTQQQQQQQQHRQQSINTPQQQRPQDHSASKAHHSQDKRSNYSSDSSAPKSSNDDGEDQPSVKVPELNSPDSISDDLVRPLLSQAHRSPRKLIVANAEHSKRNPSPYYYSDLLKAKEPTVTATTEKDSRQKLRQSTASEPPQASQPLTGPYRKSTSLDVPERTEQNTNDEQDDEFDETEATNATVLPRSQDPIPKRYSFTEDGVHIIRCESPSTTTSDESDCSECLKRREWHARALALVRKTCNVQPLNPEYGNICHDSNPETVNCTVYPEALPSMPPHRLFGPAACACVAPSLGDDLEDYFRPRSIFYVHPHGVHECDDCSTQDSKNLNSSKSRLLLDTTNSTRSDNALDSNPALGAVDEDDEMSGRTRQLYETAFDCKIAKSDDDLDEVDRITNHSVLLQLNNGNLPAKVDTRSSKSALGKNRLEGKRLKNSKNQAIQEQASNSGGNNSGSGSPLTVGASNSITVPSTRLNESMPTSISILSNELGNVHLRETQAVDQQNNPTTTSSSQLPMRGYTPSPPSTAPLPMKFPGKHERFFMNSIRSAPNLPSANPAHPRLRDLRLPIHSNLRQQPNSSLATSNENSLADSAYVNPPSSITAHNHNHHHHHQSASSHHHSNAGKPAHSSTRSRSRPRSFVLESGRVLELRKSHASHHHHVSNEGRRPHNYSSTESIATSSSGGSMESLRSSTSEGNRSTSSSESRHSTSLSSHSSESGSSSVAFPLRAPVVIHSKLHILSPISDKSSQEPASELSEQNKTQNASPEDLTTVVAVSDNHNPNQTQNSTGNVENVRPTTQLQMDALKKRRPPANKTLMQLTDEILGSDSGISLHSREDGKPLIGLQKFTLPKLNFPSTDKVNNGDITAVSTISTNSMGLPQDLRDLPFDMPKLRRRKTLQQEACTSGSATSVELGDLPFDMPKLRRRLRANQAEINSLLTHSTESSGISQASSSHSIRDDNKTALKLDSALFRQNLTLNLNESRPSGNKFGSLDLRGVTANKELNLNLNQGFATAVDLIDVSIPLERQGWYHGAITRIEAETTLRPLSEGSFLVRNCESTKQDYSLSLKGAKGFMHMRIQRNETGQYILGQFSRPFDTVPDMIRHFCLNRLPVRGAEHMCLIEPVIAQLL